MTKSPRISLYHIVLSNQHQDHYLTSVIPVFQPSLSVVVLENTITRTEPEQYVVIVHYFKYTSDVARGSVNIQDDNMSTGKCDGLSSVDSEFLGF